MFNKALKEIVEFVACKFHYEATNKIALLEGIADISEISSFFYKFLEDIKVACPKHAREIEEYVGGNEKERTQITVDLKDLHKTLLFHHGWKAFDEYLVGRTYLALDRFTLVDIVAFVYVYGRTEEYKHAANVARWFNYIQSFPSLITSHNQKKFVFVPFTSSSSSSSSHSSHSSSHSNTTATTTTTATATTIAAVDAEASVQSEGKKKEKKHQAEQAAAPKQKQETTVNNKKQKAAPSPSSPSPSTTTTTTTTTANAIDENELIQRVEFRVAFIVSAIKHPEADRLYVEQIDAGDANGHIRTIVSGLAEHIPLDQMQGRPVIICSNLKPVKLKGIESQGMVLAATDKDGKLNLVQPPKDAKIGERVIIIDNQKPADEIMNPKHKIWETIQPNLHTDSNGIAQWKNFPFRTSTGAVCEAPGINNASIK